MKEVPLSLHVQLLFHSKISGIIEISKDSYKSIPREISEKMNGITSYSSVFTSFDVLLTHASLDMFEVF